MAFEENIKFLLIYIVIYMKNIIVDVLNVDGEKEINIVGRFP